MTRMDWDRVRRGWRSGGYPPGEPARADLPPPEHPKRKKKGKRKKAAATGQAGPGKKSAPKKKPPTFSEKYEPVATSDLVSGQWVIAPWKEKVRIRSCNMDGEGRAILRYERINRENRIRGGECRVKPSDCKVIPEGTEELEQQYQRVQNVSKKSRSQQGSKDLGHRGYWRREY